MQISSDSDTNESASDTDESDEESSRQNSSDTETTSSGNTTSSNDREIRKRKKKQISKRARDNKKKKREQDVPDLSKKQLDKVKKKEFVDFDSILPKISLAQKPKKKLLQVVSHTDGFSLENTSKKREVTNLQTWLEAWGIYSKACLYYNTHPAKDLLHYQTRMAGIFKKYPSAAAINFDKDFRHRVANYDRRFKDKAPSLIANHLEGCAKIRCYICSDYDHVSSNCPVKKQAEQVESPVKTKLRRYTCNSTSHLNKSCPQRRGTSTKSQRSQLGQSNTSEAAEFFREARQTGNNFTSSSYYQGKPKCRVYNNQHTTCNWRPCRYEHLCSNCGGKHPQHYCQAKRPTFKPESTSQ